MSIVETSLIFVGVPAAVIVVVAALVYGGAAARTARYRPGGPWQFEPVWYLPHPEHAGQRLGPPPAALLDSPAGRSALPGRTAATVTTRGGASGEW